MKKTIKVELPGYITIADAANRLRLAPRSVRDLIYTGRLPSERLGRRHFLRIPDVEAERRRRLGLPRARPVIRHRRQPRPRPDVKPTPRIMGGEATIQPRAAKPAQSEARRARALERAAELERWLRSARASDAPRLPFATVDLGADSATCDTCRRPVRAGGRMVDAGPADGRPAARLCLVCARRALLAWSDRRRHEAVAARRLAADLGPTIAPRLEPPSAAA